MARRRGRRRRRTTQHILTSAVVALVAGLAVLLAKTAVGGGNDAPTSAEPGAASVVRVVDGDTLVVRLDGGGDEKLRLIGIDTPESVALDRPNECFGKEATAQLTELVPPGTAIRISRDVEPRDRYDRLLGYVYRADDDLFVNEDLVAHGFAEAKEFPPNIALAGPLEAAESHARAAKAGLWGACGSADVPL
jgi:micrococcal nuclease